MRFSTTLCAQHLGWTFKKHWQSQGKRVAKQSIALNDLEKLGIKVKNIEDITEPVTERTAILFDNEPKSRPDDTSHSNWNSQCCHIYGNENVLLQDVKQSQVLTKTVVVQSLPKTLANSLSNLQLPAAIDRNIYKIIMASQVLDAEQVKLPKSRTSERPSHNMPREYGISNQRKSHVLVNRLLMECEKMAGCHVTSRHNLLDQVDFSVTLPKNEDLLQFNISVQNMLTSAKPIEPIKGMFDGDLPNMLPLKCTVSLPKKHIYTTETFYPLSNRFGEAHPHTIFTFYDKELVGNLHGIAITPHQFQSRTLVNAFIVAAARAKQLYGDFHKEAIPKPIVVQSIHTDGRTFHFGVFQLNTLGLNDNDGLKNYWFHTDNINLFTCCGYNFGRPYLEGYNKNVFRLLSAMYYNV